MFAEKVFFWPVFGCFWFIDTESSCYRGFPGFAVELLRVYECCRGYSKILPSLIAWYPVRILYVQPLPYPISKISIQNKVNRVNGPNKNVSRRTEKGSYFTTTIYEILIAHSIRETQSVQWPFPFRYQNHNTLNDFEWCLTNNVKIKANTSYFQKRYLCACIC